MLIMSGPRTGAKNTEWQSGARAFCGNTGSRFCDRSEHRGSGQVLVQNLGVEANHLPWVFSQLLRK